MRDEWLAGHPEIVLDSSLVLADLGLSARHGRNAKVGALAEFLELVKDGRIPQGSILLVERIDRQTRDDLDDGYELFRGILRAGVESVTLSPERRLTKDSLNSLTEILLTHVELEQAGKYSAILSERLTHAWVHKTRNASEKKLTKTGPAWVKPIGNEWVLVPSAVEVVRLIFSLAIEGLGVQRIIKELDKRGMEPITKRLQVNADAKRPLGQRWNLRNVHMILNIERVSPLRLGWGET